ncbi:hypothetical protein [Runella salmonicolor]|uniref:Uncharacterized protein n=1 Tax=Runella salmonicolor TaxID=2950278 RepID=A0ABT1FVK4_9BACT|nr:hypothetical protein [Runella salmonicolor]MCP1384793.1 hypothetical protein [Runella salmonicolor]
MKTESVFLKSTNPIKMSIAMQLTIYGLYGILKIFEGIPTFNVVLGFVGSVCTVFLVKMMAAASGSASGANLSKTVSTSSFWVNTGIGFAFSLSLSTSVFEWLSPTRPWLDIHAVYFLLGSLGVIILRGTTKFFRSIEEKADDVGDAVGDTVLDRFRSKKKDSSRNGGDK